MVLVKMIYRGSKQGAIAFGTSLQEDCILVIKHKFVSERDLGWNKFQNYSFTTLPLNPNLSQVWSFIHFDLTREFDISVCMCIEVLVYSVIIMATCVLEAFMFALKIFDKMT